MNEGERKKNETENETLTVSSINPPNKLNLLARNTSTTVEYIYIYIYIYIAYLLVLEN